MTVTTLDPVRRAIIADHHIRALDRAIRTIAALAPNPDAEVHDPDAGIPLCHGCLWSGVVKPLAKLLLGPARGELAEAADRADIPKPVDLAALFDEPERPEAATETERWLRSGEAYDQVTDVWLALLRDADPANGCGLPEGAYLRGETR